jgi:hypothetical protein
VEAEAWLRGVARVPAGELTLAELFRSCGDLDPVTAHRHPDGDSRYL